MYRELENVLKSDEYLEDLRFELEHSNPNYHTVLEKRIKDMEKSDHGIVVAGMYDFGKINQSRKLINILAFTLEIISSTSLYTIYQFLIQTQL